MRLLRLAGVADDAGQNLRRMQLWQPTGKHVCTLAKPQIWHATNSRMTNALRKPWNIAQGKCIICTSPGVADAYFCAECTTLEKDRDGCPKIINVGTAKIDLIYEKKKYKS